MKMRRIIAITAGTLLVGSGLVYGFSIPGVTRPFDPANYYSETSISYADSTYTPFTMKDLARNGYQVKDVTRIDKNTISDMKTYTILVNSMQAIENKVLDMTGLPTEESDSMRFSLQNISSQTGSIQQSAAIPDVDEDTLFPTTQTVGDPSKSFDRNSQLIWLDHMYQNMLASAQDNLADSNSQTDALLAAGEASSSAVGNMAALQSNTQVQSLQTAALLRRNAMIANYIALEAAKSRADTADLVQSAQDVKNGMTFIVSDPYHPTAQEKKQYTRPEGIGFVKF